MEQLVQALHYKQEGRGLDFIDIILPAALITLGLAQPLTEMSTRNISWGIKAAGA